MLTSSILRRLLAPGLRRRSPHLHLGIRLLCILLVSASVARAQTATLRGQVFDQTGAVVPRATIALTDSQGETTTGISSSEGLYVFSSLATGKYKVQASAPDLAQEPVSIDLKPGVQTLRLELRVKATQQELTVQENPGPVLSTDSSANASSLVLSGKDLDALADDPEDMSADLQALAGPAAGPDGSAMYIDGFSGGQLPPKDAIREIRVNQNPFSPEYDKLGYGRVDILTKPGTGEFHGGGYFNFGDSVWNSRNPYAAEKAPFLLREYGATLGGPLRLRKPASFLVALDGAAINNGAIINGSIVDPSTFTIIDPYTEVFTIPQQRIRVNPRIDYQATSNDTISLRYEIADADIRHSGVGSFNLDSTGVHNHGTDQTVQFSNVLTLGANLLNETRLQYYRANISNVSESPTAQLDVMNAFTGGGAQVGSSSNTLNSWEFQNYATIARGKHTVRLGVRVRAATVDNTSPINFGGTFIFAGRTAPQLDSNNQPVLDPSGQPILSTISSIEAYRRTLLFQNAGQPPSQVLTGEYGPASTDIHHQVNVGGTIEVKGGFRLSPLFVADSGAPFNITVGQDLYGTTLFNGRPGIATDPSRPGLVPTKYGLLDPNPTADERILARNYGRSPGIFMLNLRASQVFSFGPPAEGSVSAGGRGPQTGPFGGSQGTGMVRTGHRFSLAVSLSVRNLLNHNNPGPIIGDITSSLFNQANQPYGVGSLGGTGFSESANNRRLEFQTRLTF